MDNSPKYKNVAIVYSFSSKGKLNWMCMLLFSMQWEWMVTSQAPKITKKHNKSNPYCACVMLLLKYFFSHMTALSEEKICNCRNTPSPLLSNLINVLYSNWAHKDVSRCRQDVDDAKCHCFLSVSQQLIVMFQFFKCAYQIFKSHKWDLRGTL